MTRFRKSGLKSLYPRQGRFWYALGERNEMGRLQWIGLLVIFGAFAVLLIALLVAKWPSGPALWWEKLLTEYGVYVVLVAAIVGALVIGNRVARRRRRTH